jgi:hypothetical protein
VGPEAQRLNKAAAAHGPQSPEVQERLSRILLVVRVDRGADVPDRIRHGGEAI